MKVATTVQSETLQVSCTGHGPRPTCLSPDTVTSAALTQRAFRVCVLSLHMLAVAYFHTVYPSGKPVCLERYAVSILPFIFKTVLMLRALITQCVNAHIFFFLLKSPYLGENEMIFINNFSGVKIRGLSMQQVFHFALIVALRNNYILSHLIANNTQTRLPGLTRPSLANTV